MTDSRIIATYDYTDAAGNLLYQVVRMDPKDFRQRRPNDRGGWVCNLQGVERVLYRLPEVMKASIVFWVEGEKDVETLREWGFVATTAAGGARAPWLPQYTETLRGKEEVVIIPDADAPGQERANVVARALLGHVGRLRLYRLPAGVKDITEFFEQGRSETELIATLETVTPDREPGRAVLKILKSVHHRLVGVVNGKLAVGIWRDTDTPEVRSALALIYPTCAVVYLEGECVHSKYCAGQRPTRGLAA